MQFSVTSTGTRRGVADYLNARYRLDLVPSFSRAMFFTSQRTTNNPSNNILRLRHAQHGSKIQQYFMLFTRSIGNYSRCSVLLINRCIDAAYVVTGITAPDCVYNDTLLECEMEADNMCVSDILIWQGVPLFEPTTIAGMSARFIEPFHPNRHAIMLEWVKNIRGTGSGTIPIKVATWYTNVEDAHHAYCLKESSATHLVARSNRKTIYQKDAMISLSVASSSTSSSTSITTNPNSTYTNEPVGGVGGGGLQEENTPDTNVDTNVSGIVREFYVHATDLPDVFELYSDKSMISVLESPEAVACVRSMRDSELLRDHQGSMMKFEFVSHLQKWTPFKC